MNTAIEKAHSRPSADLLLELATVANTVPRVVHDLRERAERGDRGVLDALERLAEKFGGLQRLAMLAREATRREMDDPTRSAR